MAKAIPDAILDKTLDEIATATKQVLCSAQPTTYAEANATYALADIVIDGTDFAKANGDTSGRKVTIAAQTGAGQVAQAVEAGGYGKAGWLPKMRRKTRRDVHRERIRLGILPPDVIRAATKAAAVVLDAPSPIEAYRADPEAANAVFLRELGVSQMLPDFRRAIQIQIEIMQQEEEEILLLM